LRLSGENITFDRRYRGPLDSANGGYACGRLAAYLAGRAQVTLRLPPPLARPLAVEHRDGGVVLLDGDAVVAEAVPADVDVEPPARPSWEEAEEASARHIRMPDVVFHECFSCGVRPDGLNIHVGAVDETGLQAAPWTATEVSPEVVWAGIDCAGAFAVGGPGRGEVLLGRMAAELRRLPAVGERCVVVSWPLGEDGRKLHAGTALLTADGELIARSRQTWIAPRTET
jgi:predicted amidohydrolase